VNLLADDQYTDLQSLAAGVLNKFAAGSSQNTKAVVDAGVCPQLVRLLNSPSRHLVEQVVWALGNIAKDGPHYRDMLLREGILPPLCSLVDVDNPSSFLTNINYCFSNLWRSEYSAPLLADIRPCLPALKKLLDTDCPDVLCRTCSSFLFLTDQSKDLIEAVCQLGVIPRIIELLASSTDQYIVSKAVRTLGNISTGTDDQTQILIDCGALPVFRALLASEDSTKEVIRAVSKLTAGNEKLIQHVIDDGILDALVEILVTGDFGSKDEATLALCNLAAGGSPQQLRHIICTLSKISSGRRKPLDVYCNSRRSFI